MSDSGEDGFPLKIVANNFIQAEIEIERMSEKISVLVFIHRSI
jgi:hypothetical protein